MDFNDYIGRHVKIKTSSKGSYIPLFGLCGTVTAQSGPSIGVSIDGRTNSRSALGVYWFDKHELRFLDKCEDDSMNIDFEYVAIVTLYNEYSKKFDSKEYTYALYKNDMEVVEKLSPSHVVNVIVNSSTDKNKRILGALKRVLPAKEYFDTHPSVKVTAEVVGVVNMDRYLAAKEEKIRLIELEKKKAAIEKELEAEINKRKSVEYYEEMARKYSDNPRLAELVSELKELCIQ